MDRKTKGIIATKIELPHAKCAIKADTKINAKPE